MRKIFGTIALAVFAGLAFANDFRTGEIEIKHPVAFPTVGRTGAGYMEVVNHGAADKLVGVTADFPRVMMHSTVKDGDITKMEHQMFVDIPADGMVTFEPGGLHVMFMGLSQHWMVGDEIPATLEFENAGTVEIVFKIEERPEMSHDQDNDHSDHSNH